MTIPNTVTSMGFNAFYLCNGLTSVAISDLAAWCNIYLYYNDINSNPLTYAHHLYLDGKEITDLVIPNGVTSIKKYAFYGCSGLNSVTIPSSVNSIDNSAFSGCGLTSVKLHCAKVGDSWFSGLPIKEVTIGEEVTYIGKSAFYNCTSTIMKNKGARITTVFAPC